MPDNTSKNVFVTREEITVEDGREVRRKNIYDADGNFILTAARFSKPVKPLINTTAEFVAFIILFVSAGVLPYAGFIVWFLINSKKGQ